MDTGIYELKNYGKINVNIKGVMKDKNITRNKLSKLTGCTYNVIERYYNAQIERVDLDVLAKICYVLDCEIVDVLDYVKK